MTDYSQNQNTSNEELISRIETLEAHVTEIGYVLYDVLEGLRGIPPGPDRCPPICNRADEQETS